MKSHYSSSSALWFLMLKRFFHYCLIRTHLWISNILFLKKANIFFIIVVCLWIIWEKGLNEIVKIEDRALWSLLECSYLVHASVYSKAYHGHMTHLHETSGFLDDKKYNYYFIFKQKQMYYEYIEWCSCILNKTLKKFHICAALPSSEGHFGRKVWAGLA